MGTFNDDFTGGYDSGFWTEFKSNASINITEANNELQSDYTRGGNYQEGGLRSTLAYDMGASVAANLKVTFTKLTAWTGSGTAGHLYACPTAASLPDGEANWYRIGIQYSTNLYYAQKKVSGSKTTFSSGTPVTGDPTNTVIQIDFPTTGDDVRFIVDGTEEDTDPTFSISRDCYIYPCGNYGATGAAIHEVDFDDFEMTSDDYSAGGGVTVTPAPGLVQWNGVAPSVFSINSVSPTSGLFQWAGGSPSTKNVARATLLSGLVNWVGDSPTASGVTAGVTVSPGAGEYNWIGDSPTTFSIKHAVPGGGTVQWVGSSPQTSSPRTAIISPLAGLYKWYGLSPSVDTAQAGQWNTKERVSGNWSTESRVSGTWVTKPRQ